MRLQLSKINLYRDCPGSARLMSVMGSSEVSEAQEEGILAHETVFRLYKKEEPPIGATREMIDHATRYLESIEPLLANRAITKEFEKRVTLQITQNKTVEGIADFIAYDEENNIVMVHEYKYGHVPVDVEKDLQTVIYASAAYPMADKAIVSIEQPRSFGDKASMKIYEGEAYRKVQVFARGVLFKAVQEDAPLTPGKHCLNCQAKLRCPAFKETVLNLAEAANGHAAETEENIEHTAIELSFLSRVKELLDIRINAIRDDFTHRLMRGERIPGYSVKPASSRLEWCKDSDFLKQLEKKYHISIFKEPEPITPLQALKRGVPKEVISVSAMFKQGSMKLYEVSKDDILKKLGE